VSLIVIVAYLLAILSAAIYWIATIHIGMLPKDVEPIRLGLECCLVALSGGCLYCLRAVYLNKCVEKRWDPDWLIWYLLRPVASFVCGGAAFLFLKAGLLVLDAHTPANGSEIGYFALAFVAGLNVDKFVAKIEDIAQAVFGIDKSRTASRGDKAAS
jgi:hypothetical protein